MTSKAIQEGGCTTQPPLHRALIGRDDVLHTIAALSPVGALGVAWGVGMLADPEAPARSPFFGLVVVGAALLMSLLARLRSRTRMQRRLAIVGVVGNVLLLAFTLVRAAASGVGR